MRINKHKNDCCGCTACASACPKQAITMKPDAFGFLYPEVDDELCIDCGKCVKVCSFNEDYETPFKLDSIKIYGGKHNNTKQVEKSQSGAAFVALSDYILSEGGVVYGVGYEDNFRVVYKRSTTPEERDEFRGSKYVQSDMSGILPQVKADLKEGRLVMFSGTPCQVSAVASYIGKGVLREKLFLMDIICHGVPGPFLWRDYQDFLKKKEKQKLIAVNFRDKKYGGWHSSMESFTFEDGNTRTYTYRFYEPISFRYSCFQCPYTNYRRTSDITVSDFWGVEKSKAAQLGADNKGCSLFLVNTAKGEKWFYKIKTELEYMPVSLQESWQLHLQQPSKQDKKRSQFEKDYIEHGFAYVRKKYGDVGLNHYIGLIKKKLFKVIYPIAIPFVRYVRSKRI